MRNIPKEKVIQRIHFENPWWRTGDIDAYYGRMARRAYFDLFYPLVKIDEVRRAVVLMGPRRVGKTVMLFQAVQQLIRDGADPRRVCFVSVEHPIYNGLGLEELFSHCREAVGIDDLRGFTIIFDEIQYLSDWEVHLKSLVDSYRESKFVVSGSAAAALRLKSAESGAGRFTEFLLPPLTFDEYLRLLGVGDVPIDELNRHFVDYLNYGGYPEVIFSDTMKADPGRYIRNDIIDKVLLRDLPSLYGIQDVQELNSLFTMLAFNTAQEVSLEALSQRSGVAKNTIKRYVEYLEAAFLLKRVERVDRNVRRFQRATAFKVYLTNPSIRSALFAPITADDPDMGAVVETAVFAQHFHSQLPNLYYARWNDGEVDLVSLDEATLRPEWVVEVKWSDRYVDNPHELKPLIQFCKKHALAKARVTTISRMEDRVVDGITLRFFPASWHCRLVGQLAVDPGDEHA